MLDRKNLPQISRSREMSRERQNRVNSERFEQQVGRRVIAVPHKGQINSPVNLKHSFDFMNRGPAYKQSLNMAVVRPPPAYNQNSVDANLKALRNQYEQQAAMDINQMVKENY